MSNSEKARKLYEDCNNANPVENTLMTRHYKPFKLKGGFRYGFIASILINQYALEDYEGDWIPLNRETFYIQKWDKEGWTSTKRDIYQMEKKGFVETTFKDSKNYIRLTCDDLYNADLYRNEFYEEEAK